jgi:lipoprotein-anchoring transpeptidase ErfK/SrfK
MRRKPTPLQALAILALIFAPGGAMGQFYGAGAAYPHAYESGSPESYPYGEPDAYGDFDRPNRAPARREPSDVRGYGDYDPRDDYAPDRAPLRAPRRPARVAALPADADPAYSTPLDFDGQVDPSVSTRNVIEDPTGQPAGTITIDTRVRKLYLSLGRGEAMEYGVGVGRQGFAWKGVAQIGRKAFWPGWTPPKEMLLRRPDLPDHMDGGLDNPLGARALYLFKGPKDTLFRIHGTNEPDTIGQAVSSGCIRMLNADVIDLYRRVSKGARVVVL